MTQNDPDEQLEGPIDPMTESEYFQDCRNRYLAQETALRDARSRRAIEGHRRRRERLAQEEKDRVEREESRKEKEELRKEVAKWKAERDEFNAMKAARAQTASEPTPRKDISNPTSSDLSDMANSAVQEYNPVDSAETRRQSAEKDRISPAATEREGATTRRQEKLTSENTCCSKPAAPTADEDHRTTESVVLQGRMPATAEVAATCSCAADLEKIGEAMKDAKEKLDKAQKDLEDAERRVERNNKLLLAVRDIERLSEENENDV